MSSQFRRQQYPESYFWETAEGQNWLRLLVFDIIYCFGIKGGVGAGSLLAFKSFNLVVQTVGLGALPGAYTATQIPIYMSPQEIAQKLVDMGASPQDTVSAAKFLIEKVSDPTIRNVIISTAAGITIISFLHYKTDLPPWLKIALTVISISAVLWFLFTYFPNRTTVKQDKLPIQENTNNPNPR